MDPTQHDLVGPIGQQATVVATEYPLRSLSTVIEDFR